MWRAEVETLTTHRGKHFALLRGSEHLKYAEVISLNSIATHTLAWVWTRLCHKIRHECQRRGWCTSSLSTGRKSNRTSSENMQVEYKKLPPRWHYLVSRKQMREALAARGDDVRLLQFAGTARKPDKITSGLYTGGRLDARPHDQRWIFRFRLYGLPEDLMEQAIADPVDAILQQVHRFLHDHVGTTDSTTPAWECILFWRLGDEGLVPSFQTQKVPPFSEKMAQDNPWW